VSGQNIVGAGVMAKYQYENNDNIMKIMAKKKKKRWNRGWWRVANSAASTATTGMRVSK